MKLRKDKWNNLKLEQVCDFVRGPFGGSLKKEIFVPVGFAVYEQQHAINNEFDTFRYFIDEKKFNEMKRFQVLEGDVIMSCSGTFGKIAIVPKNSRKGIINQALLKLRTKNGLDNTFFGIWLNSSSFQAKINSSVQGTAIKNIASVSFYKDLLIPLPLLTEQKQIAALFQSVDAAIEDVERQEKSIKSFQQSLISGLVNKKPVFGNLLNDQNCAATTFGEVAECDKKYPEHEKQVEHFIGLENIESGNFVLQGFGLIANGTTFTKHFTTGDVLFGKRRAYLKKVAVADFDGICSGDILVIRSKSKKLLQGLLPYYVSSDAFIQHAVSTSAGSLSPRTKWKDLATLQISLPDLKTQERILGVLQQLESTVGQLKQQKTTLKNLKQSLLNDVFAN